MCCANETLFAQRDLQLKQSSGRDIPCGDLQCGKALDWAGLLVVRESRLLIRGMVILGSDDQDDLMKGTTPSFALTPVKQLM